MDILFMHFCNNSSPNGTTAFSHVETKSDFDRNRRYQFHIYSVVITRHNHVSSFHESYISSHICGSKEELRSIIRHKRCVATSLILIQCINLSFKSLGTQHTTRFTPM